MGRKLDLSGLTDDEAEHVLQVVQRDMRLRKKEEERLSELRQELDEESRRCRLLSRQRRFNQRCCIRCCGPFTFLFNPKRQCLGCRYNVCKTCRVFSRRDNAWLCSTCQKRRLLKTQSLEWFYTNVKLRFKRYGSAKILKTLYKKHLAEHGALSELTEGSIYEESVHNEGSFCGSDSAFYRQCEELSMADTLAVAMRVAAEAIDEAVSKAEFDTDNQNEAHYLREHRGVLIEELGKTIVQKIIRKRQSLAEIKPDYEHDWSVAHSADFHHQSTCRQVHPSPTHQPNLWRSRSAFSLLDNDPLELKIGVSHNQMPPQGWKKGGGGSAMSSWRSVDRLDSSSGSSVLKSSDGNWIALQSAQLSRPSLLTKRKSLVYSALERESGVVSAYEGMGSDNEAKPEPDSSWGAVLQELHRKMTDNNPQDIHSDQSTIPSPPMGHQSSADALYSDSEGNPKPHKLLALFKRKLPQEIRRPSSSRRTSIIDVNFNPEGPGEESSGVDEQEVCKVRRSRRKRRSKKEVEVADSSSVSTDLDVSGVGMELENMAEEQTKEKEEDSEEMKYKLCRLVAQSRITYYSSTEDERDSVGQSDEEDEEKNKEQRGEEFTFKLRQLEREVRANQFSSTEDELDRVGHVDGEGEGLQKENGKKVELAATLCSLVSASQFSSMEDALDSVGGIKAEHTTEAELWFMNTDNEGAMKISMERRESIGELDAGIFTYAGDVGSEGQEVTDANRVPESDASDETRERRARATTSENVLDSETKVEGVQQEAEKSENEEVIDEKNREPTGAVEVLTEAVDERFSSTEDELESDPVGHSDGESEGVEKEEGKKVELAATLCRLADQVETAVQGAQVRHLASLVSASQFSSTEDELDPVGRGDGERERAQTGETSQGNEDGVGQSDENSEREREENEEGENEERMEGEPGEFTFKLRQLEREARANQFSSTEDELDPIGHNDGEREGVQKEEGKKVVLAATLCRLANQVRVALFSSTDDDLDRAGEGEEEINDETLWKMQVETAVQGAQVRHLASLVSASQFSSTEDELDPVGHSDGERERERAQTGETSQGNEDSVGQSDENSEREREENAEEKNREEREGRPGEFSFKLHQLVREARANLFSSTEDELEHVEHSDGGREGTQKEELADVEDLEQSISSDQEGILSPEEIQNRYSAVSLRSITTEVLKVLNATEELLQGVEGRDSSSSQATAPSLPPNADPKKLDHRFSRLEENVYVAAGTVYNLEAEIGDLEECARGISGATSDKELCFLEEQVASAAARVQQSELQISDISARIAALKTAGLNVDPQSRFTKARTIPVMPITLDSSRQRRRRLPAPPVKDKET
ncbi:uncharacterized protein myripa [Polymixia lowei]